jgi:hypothetical protein
VLQIYDGYVTEACRFDVADCRTGLSLGPLDISIRASEPGHVSIKAVIANGPLLVRLVLQ